MKKFIEDLYNYYLNNHPIPKIYIKDDGTIQNDNVYVRALFHNFQGTIVPTRKSDLEDIVNTVCIILDGMSALTGTSPYPLDENSIKLYNALCHCLLYVDYETARHSYDYDTNYDLNKFYSICQNYSINYARIFFCVADKHIIGTSRHPYGFRSEYIDLLLKDENLDKCICMSYGNNILLTRWFEPTLTVYRIDDWIKDPDIKKIWNKLPFGYIRDNYRDNDYYDTLASRNQLPLLAMCIDAVNIECEEVGKKLLFKEVERSLQTNRFISMKLTESFYLKGLDDSSLTITEKISVLLEKRPYIKELLNVFPNYRTVIKSRLEKRGSQ